MVDVHMVIAIDIVAVVFIVVVIVDITVGDGIIFLGLDFNGYC